MKDFTSKLKDAYDILEENESSNETYGYLYKFI
jgi:hypothetical protein